MHGTFYFSGKYY
jgi:general stress protein YciG